MLIRARLPVVKRKALAPALCWYGLRHRAHSCTEKGRFYRVLSSQPVAGDFNELQLKAVNRWGRWFESGPGAKSVKGLGAARLAFSLVGTLSVRVSRVV